MHKVASVIGLDLGTSGARAQAYTVTGTCLAEGRATFATTYTRYGHAEQHPADWWKACVLALRSLVVQLETNVHAIQGIGLTGQCPTFACLSLSTATTNGPALLYQDNRASTEAETLKQRFGRNAIHERTGQAPSAFYILPKLLWLQQHQPAMITGDTVIVQPRDYIGWRLTGQLYTDPTHAACTLTYDIHSRDWARDWLSTLGLDMVGWPEIVASDALNGYLSAEAAEATGLIQGLPIIMGAADSICAAYGARAFEHGVLCEVTGTSTCLHLPTTSPVTAYSVNTYPHIQAGLWYAEIGLNTTGGALAWLAALLKVQQEQLLEDAQIVPPGAEELFFLPHLSGGERDLPGRQGAFVGLQIGHSAGHLAHALLEGIAYALRQRIETLKSADCHIERVVSCGGASRSALWNQLKADILELPISVIESVDTTAWGAALIASQVLGIHIAELGHARTNYIPNNIHHSFYRANYQRFCELEDLLTHSST